MSRRLEGALVCLKECSTLNNEITTKSLLIKFSDMFKAKSTTIQYRIGRFFVNTVLTSRTPSLPSAQRGCEPTYNVNQV